MAVLPLALSACLLPQSVDQNSNRVPTVPTIDLNTLPTFLLEPSIPIYLAGTADVAANPPCHCILQLVIPVIEDEDPVIDLEARWFVDYDFNGSPQSQQIAAQQVLPGDLSGQQGTIRGPVQFDFEADTRANDPNRFHVIEMLVAEREGFDLDNAPPAHRALKREPVAYDGSTLKINVEVRTSASPQCDQNTDVRSPPLVRVCPAQQ
jgi:hypothetical protein